VQLQEVLSSVRYLGTVLSIRLYLLRVVHPSVLSCVSVSSHTRVRPGVAVGTSAHIRYLYLPPLLGQRRDDDPPAPRVGCASDTIRATNKDPRRGAADRGSNRGAPPSAGDGAPSAPPQAHQENGLAGAEFYPSYAAVVMPRPSSTTMLITASTEGVNTRRRWP